MKSTHLNLPPFGQPYQSSLFFGLSLCFLSFTSQFGCATSFNSLLDIGSAWSINHRPESTWNRLFGDVMECLLVNVEVLAHIVEGLQLPLFQESDGCMSDASSTSPIITSCIYPSMRPSAWLLWIQTLSISVAAFYPYHPRPRPTTALHDRTLLSTQAHFKHAAGGAHQGAPDAVKLHIKRQRARVGHVPPIHYNPSD